MRDFSYYSPYIEVEEALHRCRDNKGLYAKLLKSFENHYVKFDDIKRMVAEGQEEPARETAHTLKGLAGNLSLNALFNKLVEIEGTMKTGVFAGLPFNELDDALAKTKEKIAELIEDLQA